VILNGKEIEEYRKQGKITIEPWNPDQLGPNSYDLTIGDKIKQVKPNDKTAWNQAFINPHKPQEYRGGHIPKEGVVLEKGKLYLVSTVEKAGSSLFVPMVEGRSSIGRMGLFIHVTAGFGDIGFSSNWTLELVATEDILIYPGMRLGQVFFHECTSNTMQYKGRYQNQSDPQESLFNA